LYNLVLKHKSTVSNHIPLQSINNILMEISINAEQLVSLLQNRALENLNIKILTN